MFQNDRFVEIPLRLAAWHREALLCLSSSATRLEQRLEHILRCILKHLNGSNVPVQNSHISKLVQHTVVEILCLILISGELTRLVTLESLSLQLSKNALARQVSFPMEIRL